MLTIEIKVNGQLVAAISAARVSTQLTGGEHDYAAQAMEFGQFEVGANPKLLKAARTASFHARHLRKEGILRLASILCGEAWDNMRGNE